MIPMSDTAAVQLASFGITNQNWSSWQTIYKDVGLNIYLQAQPYYFF